MKLLEELWYGNIEPTEYDTSSCREYKELLQQIARKEETLLKNLSNEKAIILQIYRQCAAASNNIC